MLSTNPMCIVLFCIVNHNRNAHPVRGAGKCHNETRSMILRDWSRRKKQYSSIRCSHDSLIMPWNMCLWYNNYAKFQLELMSWSAHRRCSQFGNSSTIIVYPKPMLNKYWFSFVSTPKRAVYLFSIQTLSIRTQMHLIAQHYQHSYRKYPSECACG